VDIDPDYYAAALHHHGWAVDTPAHLRALSEGGDDAREQAVRHVHGDAVIHQDTFAQVTPAVIAVVADLVRDPQQAVADDAAHRLALVAILASVVETVRFEGEGADETLAWVAEQGWDLDAIVAESKADGTEPQELYDSGVGEGLAAQAVVRCRDLVPSILAAVTARLDDPDPDVRDRAARVAEACRAVLGPAGARPGATGPALGSGPQ
jgi:hypothetical protein